MEMSMRALLMFAFATTLLACSPPAQREAEAPPQTAPQAPACNDVAPDMGRLVRVEDELAVAAAASELRGGAIAPGLYDLTRAMRVGAATGWQGERAVALEVSENADGGAAFNWASTQSGGGETDRWSAAFSDSGAHPILTYTCGRIGAVAMEFSAQGNALTLRIPDGANGSLHLEFQRRT
jgi:hypothetical protein